MSVSAGEFARDACHQLPQPLSQIVSFGQAGCDLLVSPVVSLLAMPSGAYTSQLPIPNDPGLAGATVTQQVLVLDVDAQLQPLNVASSNALRLEVGVF